MDIPKVGDPLNVEHFDMILEAIKKRQENFPDEHPTMSMALVIFNIGDRFAPVECIEQEWTGFKQDIPKGEGIPKCPNGHVLTQGAGLRLGWISAEIPDDPRNNKG